MRSQFQYFSINERGESCCTALHNFGSTKKYIATLLKSLLSPWNNCEVFVELRFFATAFEVYPGNSVVVNSSCLIIAII